MKTSKNQYPLRARLLHVLVAPSELFMGLPTPRPFLDCLLFSCTLTGLVVYGFWSSGVGERVVETEQSVALDALADRMSTLGLSDEQMTASVRATVEHWPTPLQNSVMAGVSIASSTVFSAFILHVSFTVLFPFQGISLRSVIAVTSHASVIWVMENVLLLCLTASTGKNMHSGSVVTLLSFVLFVPSSNCHVCPTGQSGCFCIVGGFCAFNCRERALAELYVNVSAHTAPIIQPPASTPADASGRCRRSLLYFRMAHRTNRPLKWRKTGYRADL